MYRSTKVKIFYTLLVLSLAEAILWSLPLGGGDIASSQYFERETGNFKSTDSNIWPSIRATGLRFDGIAYAVKVEAQATQRLQQLVEVYTRKTSVSHSRQPHHYFPEFEGISDSEARAAETDGLISSCLLL